MRFWIGTGRGLHLKRRDLCARQRLRTGRDTVAAAGKTLFLSAYLARICKGPVIAMVVRGAYEGSPKSAGPSSPGHSTRARTSMFPRSRYIRR
jgi:hypothetical protein